MSSLRNAVKRITHKERSQPIARSRLGLLEKKKDYKVRSADYHRKQDTISTLRQKASERNPDEFYFGMTNAEVKSGRHRKLEKAKAEEREREIGPEVVRLMKTQDLGYIRMKTSMDERKVERLEANLHLLGDNPAVVGTDHGEENDGDGERERDGGKGSSKTRTNHTIFVDSLEQAKNFNAVEYFDTVPQMAERTFNRLRKEQLLQMATTSTTIDEDGLVKLPSAKSKELEAKRIRKLTRKVAKARASAYAELEARKRRIGLLKHTESHLVTERVVASKGRKRKIAEAENGKPAVYKFRRRRAR